MINTIVENSSKLGKRFYTPLQCKKLKVYTEQLQYECGHSSLRFQKGGWGVGR